MRRSGFLCILILGLLASQIMAQAATRYYWEVADLGFPIPTGWADPVPLEQDGAPVLLLRPTLLGSDATQNISIEFKLLDAAFDMATLQAEFDRRGVTMSVSRGLIGFGSGEALEGFGLNTEQNLYLRIHVDEQMDSRLVVVTASGPVEKLDEINATFLQIIGATATSDEEASVPTALPYSTLWERSSTGADGEQAFIQPQALVAGLSRLYVADLLNGILAFDPLTGDYLWTQRVAPDAQITALAVGANGMLFDILYAADTGPCACLYRVTQVGAEIIADGFGAGAPSSLAVRADGAVLATDVGADGSVRVRVIGAEGEQESLIFETPQLSQPLLLTAPDNTVYAITEGNELLRQDGAGFSLIAPLGIPVVNGTTHIAMDENGLLTAFEGSEIYTFDSQGTATLVSDPRFPVFSTLDSVVAGVAVGVDGTLFTLESSPADARLAARSRTITERLIPNRPVKPTQPGSEQIWLIAGQAGDVIDLTAAPIDADESFLMTLSLIDANGEILGEHIITAAPEPPVSIRLEEPGLYFLLAQNANSIPQNYELGYRVPYLLTGVDQTVTGALTQAMPIQRWILNATAGQTLSIGVMPTSGTLDPSVRLVNPRGDEVALNEDVDPALGLDAALMDIRLSNNGVYVIEVTATTGAGGYQFTVDIEE